MGTVSRRPVTKAAHGLLRRCGVPCKPQCHTPGRPLHPSVRLWFASPQHSVCRHLCLCCCWCIRCCAMSRFLWAAKRRPRHGGTGGVAARGLPGGAAAGIRAAGDAGAAVPLPRLGRCRLLERQHLVRAPPLSAGLLLPCADSRRSNCKGRGPLLRAAASDVLLQSALNAQFVVCHGCAAGAAAAARAAAAGGLCPQHSHPVSQWHAAGADAAAQAAAAGGLCVQHIMCCFPGACGWR